MGSQIYKEQVRNAHAKVQTVQYTVLSEEIGNQAAFNLMSLTVVRGDVCVWLQER